MKNTFILTMCLAVPVSFAADPANKNHGDAAIKAQEGEINHWIEYYRNQNKSATERRSAGNPTGRTTVKDSATATPGVAPDAAAGK